MNLDGEVADGVRVFEHFGARYMVVLVAILLHELKVKVAATTARIGGARLQQRL